MQQSNPAYARLMSTVLPEHDPTRTSHNSFQPFNKPFADKVVNPLYAQEVDLPKLRSSLLHGHEADACCKCSHPMQRFHYHRHRGEAFAQPEGSFAKHPAFHCE